MAPRPLSHAVVLAFFRAVSKIHSAYASPSLRRGSQEAYPAYAFAVAEEPVEEPGSIDFWTHILISGGLVVSGGVFAGYVHCSYAF
jgi:hypothetical protein